jgi:hypothetical protein
MRSGNEDREKMKAVRNKKQRSEEKHQTPDKKHDFSRPFARSLSPFSLSAKYENFFFLPADHFELFSREKTHSPLSSSADFEWIVAKKTVEIVHSRRKRRFGLKLDAEIFFKRFSI